MKLSWTIHQQIPPKQKTLKYKKTSGHRGWKQFQKDRAFKLRCWIPTKHIKVPATTEATPRKIHIKETYNSNGSYNLGESYWINISPAYK